MAGDLNEVLLAVGRVEGKVEGVAERLDHLAVRFDASEATRATAQAEHRDRLTRLEVALEHRNGATGPAEPAPNGAAAEDRAIAGLVRRYGPWILVALLSAGGGGAIGWLKAFATVAAPAPASAASAPLAGDGHH